MKDLLYAALALISAIVAGYSFYSFQQDVNTTMLYVAILFVLGTLVFGAMFLMGRVNKQDDIHITE